MIGIDNIYNMDCLEGMKQIPDGTIDAVICDLPYGTTACAWDSVIPFDKLWEQYRRIVKPTGAIVLFSQQPFTSALIMSNINDYKYNWIWQKDSGTNFLNAHHQPLKITEDICVFGQAATTESKRGIYLNYNPQMREGFEPYERTRGERTPTSVVRSNVKRCTTNNDGTRYPTNLLYFKRDKEKLHQTAKPVDLLRYLIRTYTNINALVLDNCCGSGSTCVAAIREKRNFIGIELNDKYFDIASNRINSETQQLTLF